MKRTAIELLTARTPAEIKRKIAYYQNTFRKLEKAGADFDVLYSIKETIDMLNEDLRCAYADQEVEED